MSASPSTTRPSDIVICIPREKLLAGVRAAQREGLTVEQASERLAQSREFRTYLEPPPGHWLYNGHNRNLRNLWRICEEESRRTKQTEPMNPVTPYSIRTPKEQVEGQAFR